MSQALSTNSSSNSKLYSQAIYWFFVAAITSISYIVLHELAHFSTAKLLGASDISFHWAFVEHDTSSVSNIDNALIALLGPLFSYLLVAVTWWFSRKTSSPFLLALGFSAAFRCLVVLPFVIRTLLGRDTSTFFFDEIRGASAIGISPLFFVIVSLIVGFVGTIYFSRKAKQQKNTLIMLLMIAGTFLGIYTWSIFGPILFPGGPGLN